MTSPQPIVASPICYCEQIACTVPYGLCHCGCRKETTVARWNNARLGHKKGVPKLFIHNHHRVVLRTDVSDELPFEVEGQMCRRIALTKEQFTIVSEGRFHSLNAKIWGAKWSKNTGSYYAVRLERINGKMVNILMHREILGLPPGRVNKGDHKNQNTLDNRDDNLRPATNSQSGQNRRRGKNNTTGYKGVYFQKRSGKFWALITVNKVRIHLGYFDTAEEAYAAYCVAAIKYFGEFARLA